MPTWTRAVLCVPAAALALIAGGNRCEPGTEAQQALDRMTEKSRDMKYNERTAYERKTLEELMRQYPDEIAIQRQYIDIFKNDLVDELPAIQKQYRDRADAHPDDPIALYLAGVTQQGRSTAEAIRLMEAAKKQDPKLGWAYLSLTNTYSRGKYADRAKASENIANYFQVCPAGTYSWPLWLLGEQGAPEAQAAVARQLREKLATMSDPKKLKTFSDVWGIEFRTRPVAEHARLRTQVAEDLKWLEGKNPKPDAAWLNFLKGGYKQTGAPAATIDALDERILEEFPSSDEALGVLQAHAKKALPEPKGDAPVEEWNKYFQAQIANYERWIPRFPKAYWLKSSLAYTMRQLHPPPMDRLTALAEASLKDGEDRWGPDWYSRLDLAEYFANHHYEPERVMELVQGAIPAMQKDWREQDLSDNRTDKQIEDSEKSRTRYRYWTKNLMLRADRDLGTEPVKVTLDSSPPKDETLVSRYWHNKALEAEIEGRKTDALTFYQAALNSRQKAPQKVHGVIEDPLLDDAHHVFTAAGGTETAWTVWSQRPASKSITATDARWEAPGKTLPNFQLADLTGKNWTLKALEGKTVLITVWASW